MSIKQHLSTSVPLLAIVMLITLCNLTHATTIISVINRNGIVLLSDSETSVPNGGVRDEQICPSTTKKILIIKARFGIAASDSACFQEHFLWSGKQTELSFEFGSWISEVEKSLPIVITFDGFVQTVKDRFSELIPKLQIIVTDGAWGKRQDPAENFESLITFTITGYDTKEPRLSVVKVYINWDTKTILGPYVIPVDLGHVERGGMSVRYVGVFDAVTPLSNSDSYVYKYAKETYRDVFTKFLSRPGSLTLAESVILTRAMIEVEEKASPQVVGGDIGGVKISPDGKATEVAYSPSKANTSRKKAESPKKHK